MKEIFGFIGTGNMGTALASAVCKKAEPSRILLSNRTHEKAARLAKDLGAVATDNITVAKKATYIFLGVKPQGMEALFGEISPVLRERKDRFLLVTMAAGLSTETIASLCGFSVPVIRIMPNTPSSVGEGMILYTANSQVTETEITLFSDSLSHAGMALRIDEDKIDAASVISGCGPAFHFMFIDAMTKAGVALGLDQTLSRLCAEQTMLGSAKLAIETGEEPDSLKIKVCSPGGTTIEGVHSFEKNNLEGIVSEAVSASYKRTLELAGK